MFAVVGQPLGDPGSAPEAADGLAVAAAAVAVVAVVATAAVAAAWATACRRHVLYGSYHDE